MTDITQVRQGYDRWAAVYDHDANPLPALEEPVVQAAAGDVEGLTVLDLGCGTGRHAHWLAEAGAQVTAIDFSEGMLEEARGKPGASSIDFQSHDLHQPLPFDAQFDLVVSGLVMEHIRELRKLFGEVHRVLRPGGRFIFSAMHPAMFLRGSQARFTDPDTGQIVQPGSINHEFSGFVLSALQAEFTIDNLTEHAPDAEFVSRFPRAEKYTDYPMLMVFSLSIAAIA